MLLSNYLLIPAFAVIPIHSFPSSVYTFSPYPSSTAFPFIPQNLTSFTQPSSPNNFTTDGPYLEVVHEIYNLTTFPTGVAVDQDDRIFINFPRSASSNEVTLGLADSFNTTAAYPNASIQTCQRGQNVSTCFVNIQSVVIDSAQRIWALDTGMGPGQTDAVEYGAKIMSFNLTTNEMIDNYVLPYSISANGTSINDVRFNLSMSTAGVAFLTDEQGSLIIIDLGLHTYTRRLFNTSVVLADELFVGSFDGTPFYEWNGTQRSHVKIGSDGIALANGNLYFAPLASRRLYQINQTTLANASFTDTEMLNAVEFVGQTGSYLEGFTADDQGRVYMGTAEQNSITYFNTSISSLTNSTMLNGLNASSTNATNEGVIPASDIEVAPFIRSADIQWPDSMCVQNGYLWFTTNQLPLQGTYQRNSITKASLPYKVYRTSIGGAGPAV
ncbi:major royal jelly protein-domain-containing protein [Usnea florida]